ncbi:MAG TPA: hypothetical protein IGS17_14130 [Oscillatoriales cyanobacterium M59_W2019_021]|nr:hypothetical protein [Oscillatoriales cyanobacterium M4454_W2019_049]HIK52042.1 hypothetical protein [Oscillatoriales cyanobacterium M59_W2019_021]
MVIYHFWESRSVIGSEKSTERSLAVVPKIEPTDAEAFPGLIRYLGAIALRDGVDFNPVFLSWMFHRLKN